MSWDVSDEISFLSLFFVVVVVCVQMSVFSAGPLRRMQSAISLHSNVHMFALDLKYRCIHYVSEHSRFKSVCPNIGDLPQVQRQMSNTHACLFAGMDLLCM